MTFEARESARNGTLTRSFIFDSWLDIELGILKSLDYTDPHSDAGRRRNNEDRAAGATHVDRCNRLVVDEGGCLGMADIEEEDADSVSSVGAADRVESEPLERCNWQHAKGDRSPN